MTVMNRNISELICDLKLRSDRGLVSTLSVGEAQLVCDALIGFRQVTKHRDDHGLRNLTEIIDKWRVE